MKMRLLRDRNFFLLMQGSMASQIGTIMMTFALSLYVLSRYESTTLFASILIFSAIPRLILGPFAGVLVDWFNRKKIIVRLDILSGIFVTLLGILYVYLGYLPLWSIYSIVIILSLITTLFGPAISTVIPTIMKSEDLLEANSLSNVLITLSNMVSPLIAGFFMSFTGIGIIIFLNGISFFVSALSESFIEIPEMHNTPEKINVKVFKDDFLEGITLIKTSRYLLTITIVALALNFAIAPVFSIGVPHIFKKVMEIKDYEYGIVNSIMAIAALVGGVSTAVIGKKVKLKRILAIDLYTQPIVVGLLAFIASAGFLSIFTSYYIPLILFVIVGFIFVIILTIGNIAINTSIQKIVPKNMLGRVGTVVGTICGGAVPLGQALFGLMTDSFGHVLPMVLCSGILLVVSIVSVNIINKEQIVQEAA